MKQLTTLISFIFFTCSLGFAQIVPVRQLVSCTGKDSTIGLTNWAYSIGEPMVISYVNTNPNITEGFHQPDGYAVKPVLPYVSNLVIFPNPAKPKAQLRFYLKSDKLPITLEIFDAMGKLYLIQKITPYAGQTFHSLNPQIMAAGTYLVRLTTDVDGESYSGKLIISN